ncbi:GRAM domain-containing protein [Tieghemostelium lacteum]|uniref:GRAM domain-containing protein n=1 Tax=Tieghemostelium lacteum TaxID=361077 RepID=A0A151Z7D6_TIELA|nr:GRAM domain-containing protein [Tieghemostelium lacteum]|eukprot:KYQ89872.1 GRAM domain-containing protein [Tieghemostelium lacteum]
MSNLFNKLLQGYAIKFIEEKLVHFLSNNRHFQNMSLKFRDKVQDIDQSISNKTIKNKKLNNSNNNNVKQPKYTNNIYENQRLYEQQQKSKNFHNTKEREQHQSRHKPKSYFSHLIDSVKQEASNELKRFKK